MSCGQPWGGLFKRGIAHRGNHRALHYPIGQQFGGDPLDARRVDVSLDQIAAATATLKVLGQSQIGRVARHTLGRPIGRPGAG